MNRLLSSRWLPLAAAAVLLLVLAAQFVKIRVPSRPVRGIEALRELRDRDDLNVVFVLVDTLRADRLSAYGYGRPTSPTLVDLAHSGVRFAHVQSQSSWTKTSMASLWTGTYPGRNGVLRYPDAIPESRKLPAEILKEAGYETLRHLPQRLGRQQLRVRAGLRRVRDAGAPPPGRRRARQPFGRPPPGLRLRRERVRGRVPAGCRRAQDLPLPPLHGRAPVRLRRPVVALRDDASRTPTTTRSTGWTGTSSTCSRRSTRRSSSTARSS